MRKLFKDKILMYKILLTIFMVPLIIGCSTLGKNSLKNDISLSLSSGYLHFVDIRRDQSSLYISGKINKPLGKNLSKTKIIATFMDAENNIMAQIQERVNPSRTRLHRGRYGRFFIKIPYNSAIRSCELQVEWN